MNILYFWLGGVIAYLIYYLSHLRTSGFFKEIKDFPLFFNICHIFRFIIWEALMWPYYGAKDLLFEKDEK